MVPKREISKRVERSNVDSTHVFVDGQGKRWRITAELKSFSGRMDIAAITIQSSNKSHPVTRRLLSSIPLKEIFERELTYLSPQLLERNQRNFTSSSHQGRAHSASELQVVADIYRAAFQSRLPVQRTVAESLGVSVSTAAKRIMAARQHGFLQER
jgi:hypothetical protein